MVDFNIYLKSNYHGSEEWYNQKMDFWILSLYWENIKSTIFKHKVIKRIIQMEFKNCFTCRKKHWSHMIIILAFYIKHQIDNITPLGSVLKSKLIENHSFKGLSRKRLYIFLRLFNKHGEFFRLNEFIVYLPFTTQLGILKAFVHMWLIYMIFKVFFSLSSIY